MNLGTRQDNLAVNAREPLRILIAEDHDDSRQALAVLFSMCGYRVRAASNGEEALSFAREFFPQLVFLDLWMPQMNGAEACEQMRAGPCPPPIPIYAVTADRPDPRMVECFDSVLYKPLDFAALAQLASEVETSVENTAEGYR